MGLKNIESELFLLNLIKTAHIVSKVFVTRDQVFFAPLTSPDIKSRCHKKVGMDYLFWTIFKIAAIEIGNHVLCLNLSSEAVRVTELMSIHLGSSF